MKIADSFEDPPLPPASCKKGELEQLQFSEEK